MLEARTFVKSFDEAKGVLESLGALFKGEYIIHDIIYAPKDPNKTLVDEFMRLRIVSKNIWDEKPFIVAIKNTELKDIGKSYTMPLKKQFDSREEAQKFIDENLLDKFQYLYEFSRVGCQYYAGKYFIDLEDIEGNLSLEVKAEKEEDLRDLVNMLNIKDTIKGPSVVAVKEILKR